MVKVNISSTKRATMRGRTTNERRKGKDIVSKCAKCSLVTTHIWESFELYHYKKKQKKNKKNSDSINLHEQ